MIKTLKVRLYPDEEQKILLEKHFGSCRWVRNQFLDIRNRYHIDRKNHKKRERLSGFDTMKMLTLMKMDVAWLNEINSQSLQHSLVELDKVFRSSFKHNTSYLRFKSKKGKQYFIAPSGFKADERKLIFPNLRIE